MANLKQTVAFADGRVRLRNVHCLGKKNGVRVGETWIGDRMTRVTEVEFGVWREARVGETWIGDRMARVTEVEFGVWREEKPKE